MTYASFSAIALSAVLITMLCLGDPKRRRSAKIGDGEQSRTTRWLLTVAACLPGAWLAVIGDAPGFLIWLGGCSVIGWLLALIFGALNRQTTAARDR